MRVDLRKQYGGIWVGNTLLLLLLIVSTSTTLTLRMIGSSEQGFWRQHYALVNAALTQKMARVQASMLSAPKWPDDMPAELAQYVSQVQTVEQADVKMLTADIRISHQEGGYTAFRSASVVRFPLLMSLPVAPLIVTTSLHHLASFFLYLPPQQAHPEYHYAVWSSQAIDMHSAIRTTCTLAVIDHTQCQAAPLSNGGSKGSDILDSDPRIGVSALSYLFASNAEDNNINTYRQLAWYHHSNCANLPSNPIFIWITGDCTIVQGNIIGDQDHPVLFVVENGDLELEAHSAIVGVVVSLREGNLFSHKVRMDETAYVSGSVITNHETSSDSHFNVIYNYDALFALQHSYKLQQLAVIPGSVR